MSGICVKRNLEVFFCKIKTLVWGPKLTFETAFMVNETHPLKSFTHPLSINSILAIYIHTHTAAADTATLLVS